jgi:branched-chain amino acid transport system permease protein
MSSLLERVGGARVVLIAAGLIAFLIFPMVASEYIRHLAILAMIFAIVASNWDLTLGYAGLFNFAHIAFFGIGAYTSGILAVRYGLSPWLGIVAGTVVAVVISVIVSVPAIRLRGIYVALITFAFSQLALLLIVSQHTITGGQQGLVGVPSLAIGDLRFRDSNVAYFYFIGLVLLISTLFLRRLVNSDFGLSLVALRDFESYAVSRGVPLARQRFLAFLYSSIFTGAAGALFAHYLLVASPEYFGFSFGILFLSMVLIGGTATIYGPIVAGILLTFFSELLAGLGPVRFMLVSVLIVLTMRFFPQGIWGIVKSRRFYLAEPDTDQESPALTEEPGGAQEPADPAVTPTSVPKKQSPS